MIASVISSAKQLSSVFEDSKTRRIPGLYGELSDLVRDIPHQMDDMVSSSRILVMAVQKFHGFPWVVTIKRLANQIQAFTEDIKDDAMKFYNVRFVPC